MKVSPPKAKPFKKNKVPMPLKTPPKKPLQNGDFLKLRLLSTPADQESLTYEMQVPYYRSGKLEDWFKFRQNLQQVFLGQRITSGPNQFTMTRRFLSGSPEKVFNRKAAEGTETVAHLKVCLQEVTKYLLPPNALKKQREYMRNGCFKPEDMSIKDYLSRIHEMNEHLAMFSENGDNNKFSEAELKEIAENAIPKK